MTDVEVVLYDARWEAAQTAFAARNWPGKVRRGDPGYQRWEYRAATKGPVEGLLLAVDGDEVIGQAGCLPGQAYFKGGTRPVQWLCNIAVDAEHRRRGVGTALLDVLLSRPVVVLGPDPSPPALKTMASVGFVQSPCSYVMVLPLRAGAVLAHRYPQLAPVEPVLTALGRPAVRSVARRALEGQRSVRAQICSWREVVGDVARAEATMTLAHAVHDEEFLRWRCSGLDGFVREMEAVRTDAGSFALLERDDVRLGVHQWHAIDDEELAAVIGRAMYIGDAYGLEHLQAFAASEEERHRLERLGFRPRRTRVDMWAYPGDALAGSPFAFAGYDSDYFL